MPAVVVTWQVDFFHQTPIKVLLSYGVITIPLLSISRAFASFNVGENYILIKLQG